MLTSVQPREAARPYGEDEDGKYAIPSCPALRYIMWPAGYGPANHLEASAAALKRTLEISTEPCFREYLADPKSLHCADPAWFSQGRCRPVRPSLRTLLV